MTATDIDQLLHRHVLFWRQGAVDRPLVGKVPTTRLEPKPYPVRGGRELIDPTPLRPQDVDVDRLVGADRAPGQLLIGDLIQPAGCVYPEAWMESLIGCPIMASAYGVVAQPVGLSLAEALDGFSIEAALQSGWAGIMDSVLLRQREVFGQSLPVRQLHQRGIIDMLAACLGEVQLCTCALDQPRLLEELADRFAELYFLVANRGLTMRAPWHGGYVSVWNVYAPRPVLDYQVDASSLFSSALYEKCFLKCDRRVLSQFPYCVIHVHACGLHILDALLKLDELSAVQIRLDRETGIWEKERVLACCKNVQKCSKSLIVTGELTEDELAEFLSALRPEGLAIYYWNP